MSNSAFKLGSYVYRVDDNAKGRIVEVRNDGFKTYYVVDFASFMSGCVSDNDYGVYTEADLRADLK